MLLLAYDIPKTKSALLVRVWRELKRVGAKKISSSLWSLEDNEINLGILKNIKDMINRHGGDAKLLRVVEIE
jgi:hypothetical protein